MELPGTVVPMTQLLHTKVDIPQHALAITA
jgi:hypothetical protein